MERENLDYQTYILKDDGEIPNNANLPLVIYPGILNKYMDQIDDMFLKKGWNGTWIGSVYEYHHYHSTAHEVLGVLSGHAIIQFGGKQGVTLEASEGDVIMIPAGVGHKKIESTQDFRVVGGYPQGQDKDHCVGNSSERPEVLENIKQVPLPNTDPVFGENGKLLDLWAIQ